ncbi:WD repeat protein [Peziza echinospora]|nr:WD repeat protein [Peziza echinospora]
MSVTSDKDKFFQTSASLEEDQRRALKATNTAGSPIQTGSKILDILPDPTNPSRVFLACSASIARRVDYTSGEKGNHIYKGHTAPVTSLAINHTNTTLFTGSWDKTIRSYDIETRKPLLTLDGHWDFVKCLLFLPPLSSTTSHAGLLLSGSADASIIIWHPTTGQKLHVLKGHLRGVTTLALDPLSSASTGGYTVFSGDSVRDIRQWHISPDGRTAHESPLTSSGEGPLAVHETSIYRLRFGGEDFDELWSASADGYARCTDIRGTRLPEPGPPGNGFKHPDYVNDIALDSISYRWVVTACRDENVRVWEKQTGRLWHTFVGHYEEVTALCMVGWEVLSAGIDGTLRRWSLEPRELARAVEEADVKEVMELKAQAPGKKSLLTLEEEAELAELMGSDEE